MEFTRAREGAATSEAARITKVHAVETSVQEVVAAWDSTTVHIRDTEDQAILVEGEAQERMSKVEAKNAVALASAHEDTEGLVWKVALPKGELAVARRLERWSR